MARKLINRLARILAAGVAAAAVLFAGLVATSSRLCAQTTPPAPQFISAPSIPLTSSSSPSGTALADLTGNGKLDLIVSENGVIDVYLGNGDGTFQSTPLVTTTSCGAGSFAVGNIQGTSSPPGLVMSDQCGNAEVFFGKGDGTFQLNASYPEPYTGGVAAPVYLADMNGDGLLDIFVDVSFMNQFAVLFNKPSTPGTFGTAQTINLSSVVSYPVQFSGQFALADFVAGGPPDLALGLTQFGPPLVNSVRVLLNNLTSSVTSGTNNDISSYFAPQPIITLTNTTTNPNATQMSSLVAADFGNGNVDLLASEPESGSSTGTFYFLEGDGVGSFNAPQSLPSEPVPFAGRLAVADFNGDGKPDLAATNENDGVTLLLNQGITNGQISFNAGNSYVAGEYPQAPVTGVLTSSGFTDLIIPTGEGLSVFLSNGNGTFKGATSFNAGKTPQNLIEMWNLNGQGETDLAMIDPTDQRVNYLVTPGAPLPPNGTLSPPNPFFINPPVVGETPTAIAGGCLKSTDQPPTCASFLAMAALDFSSDSFAGASDLEIFLSAGQPYPGVFVVPLPSYTNVQAMAVGDFNGDGDNDLAIALSTGEVEIFTGNGAGSFSSNPAITLSGSLDPIQLAVADFNGEPDIAVLDRGSNTSAGAVELFLNNTPSGGALSFQIMATYPVISSITRATPWTSSMAVADFNGDGAPDVAVVEYTTQELQVFLNFGGTGLLDTLAPQRIFGLTGAIVAGDFNGDGKMDLAATNSGLLGSSCNIDDAVQVLTGNGDGTFNATNPCGFDNTGFLFSAGSGPQSLVAGNFNGADKYDLAVADNSGNMVTLLLQTSPAPPPTLITISPGTIPAAYIGLPYSQTFTPSGGTGTVTFSVTGGALPGGMTMRSGGVLSGAPTEAGQFPFTITATASNGTGQQSYNLNVQETFLLSPSVLDFGTVAVGTTATLQLRMTNEYSSTISWGFVFPIGSPFGATSNGSTCAGPLGPGASCTENMTFTPTAVGTVPTAKVCILINQPDVANACEDIFLTGTGVTSSILVATMTAAPNPVIAGQTLTYTIVITNNGSTSASNVNFNDPLPSSENFSSVTVTPTALCTAPAVGSTGTVTCPLGTMGPTTQTTITLVVVPTQVNSSLANAASVSANNLTPVSAMYTVSALPITVTLPTDNETIDVSDTQTPPSVSILYPALSIAPPVVALVTDPSYSATFTITNKGNATANKVVVKASSIVTDVNGTLESTATSTTLPVNVGNFAPGQSATVTLTYPITTSDPQGIAGIFRIALGYTSGATGASFKVTLP